jgi:hypothetical protein
MLVSGTDTGYNGNSQSVTLAANDVGYTWGLSQPAANQYAIFQTHNPWGSTILETAITKAGHTYTVFPPSALTGFSFASYSVVILNWDDTFVSAFDPPYTSVIPALQTYVLNGGMLWIQGAIQNGGAVTTYSLPFGGTATFDLESWDYIDIPSSALITGVPNPFHGTWASHASFTGIPASSQVVVSVGQTPGGTAVQYVYQTGVCPPTPTPVGTPPAITATPTPSPTPRFSPTPTAVFTWTPTPTKVAEVFNVCKNVFNIPKDITVCIEYGSNEYPGHLSLRIYNSAGEHIKTLVDENLTQPLSPTYYYWDGTNTAGYKVVSGVYLVYLQKPFGVSFSRLIVLH